jgi:hypothetical protein
MGYWGDVTNISWRETKESFGWTKKTAATVLLALGAVITASLKLGLAGMTETAVGYFWIGFAPIFAGLVLFAWNFLEAQGRMYENLTRSCAATNAELQEAVSRSKEAPPNYAAWRHVDEMTLHNAACLWCDIEPRMSIPPKVRAWLHALESAVKTGDLGFSPKYSNGSLTGPDYIRQQEEAWPETKATRADLKTFATKHGYDPIFLRDV